MVTSFWSKIYAVTWWTNCESLGEHPMWMFYICLVQWHSQVTGIILAGHLLYASPWCFGRARARPGPALATLLA